MVLKIFIMDEFYKIEKFLGIISNDDVEEIVKIAEEKNMRCLRFISNLEDSIFNDKQAVIIQDELKELRKAKVKERALSAIEEGSETIVSDVYTYLLFESNNMEYDGQNVYWNSSLQMFRS